MCIRDSSKDGLPTLLSTLGCPIPYAMTFFLIGRYFVCLLYTSGKTLADKAKELGVVEGVWVSEIVENGSASGADIKVDDVISIKQ